MSATLPFPRDELLPRFDGPGVGAIVLMGSYARGDPGPHSDVDGCGCWMEVSPPCRAVVAISSPGTWSWSPT